MTYAGYWDESTFCNSMKLKYLNLPNAKEIPTFSWETQSVGFINSGSEAALAYIYAPKATGFTNTDLDLYYFKDFKFIFAPNLESLAVSDDLKSFYEDARFLKDSEVKLYLSDQFTLYTIHGTSSAQLTIVALENSYAHTVATENGFEFISSDDMAETLGGQIRTRDSGLRFGFTLDSTDIGFDYESLADDVEYGFVYTYDEVSESEQEANAQVRNGADGTYTIEAAKRNVEGTVSQYNAVFTGIPASHYDSKISARAYVCIDGMYFYSPVTTRSFNDVANAILNDNTMDSNTRSEVYTLIHNS